MAKANSDFRTKCNKIVIGVTDVIIHTRFDNDRSGEYSVTEGQILACSI